MADKINERLYAKRLFLGDAGTQLKDQGHLENAAAGVTSFAPQACGIELNIQDTQLDVTDTGGANGGYFSLKVSDLPARNQFLVGGRYNFQVNSVGAGISASATGIQMALGFTEKTSGGSIPAFNTLSKLMATILTFSLTAGASPATLGINALTTVYYDPDGADGDGIYLNGYIPDASITADTTINVTLTGSIVLFPVGGF